MKPIIYNVGPKKYEDVENFRYCADWVIIYYDAKVEYVGGYRDRDDIMYGVLESGQDVYENMTHSKMCNFTSGLLTFNEAIDNKLKDIIEGKTKMEVYNVATPREKDEDSWVEYEVSSIEPHELDDFEGEWAVVAYWVGSYCGTGEMIIKVGDELHLYNLGHCSCYGPLDNGFDCEQVQPHSVFTVEEFLSGDIQKCSTYKDVNDKVRELCVTN